MGWFDRKPKVRKFPEEEPRMELPKRDFPSRAESLMTLQQDLLDENQARYDRVRQAVHKWSLDNYPAVTPEMSRELQEQVRAAYVNPQGLTAKP